MYCVYTCIECRGFESHLRQLIFSRKSDCLGCAVLLCLVCLFVCLTLLASFFLPSHLSFKNMYMYIIICKLTEREWLWFMLLPPAASAPSNLTAVQEGLTSVRVSWSPPTPLGDTTGYRISYSGGSSASVDVSDGSTNTHTLTGLENGASYNISIVGTSLHLPSEVVDVDIGLGE